MPSSMPAFTDRFSVLAPNYDLLLCDVWGVVHNGVAAYPEACDALKRFRAGGGSVILITNAPRPGEAVVPLLDRYGVAREAYDGIVSSGDVTREAIGGRPGESVFHLGPERDRSIFDGLGLRFAPVESADYAVCSGLADDETETPEDYRALLGVMRQRNLFMICGNPDVVVERGDKRIYCAGAIADLYGTLGGKVLYAGKPYRPIYDRALAKAAQARGAAVAHRRVLAIGDSLRTDFTGARELGIDFLFVTSGIHAEELGARDNPDAAALREIFSAAGQSPKGITRRLAW